MGYGKTTAVKEFLTPKSSLTLWISIPVAENSVSFFWDEFAKQMAIFDDTTGKRLSSLGFPADAPQMAYVLSMLRGIDYRQNSILVVDDFYLVKSPQVGDFLARIAKEELDNFHIVVITRDTTNIDLAELTAKGICHIISQQVLRFTEEETRAYCTAIGYRPSDSDLARICEYTGGWISLIYLTVRGLERGVPIGRSSIIDELVERVLYSIYSERIRDFLPKVAVMEGFTVEQAVFVTQESRAGEFLKRLRRENAFVTYDETAGTYRIHNLLLDFLRMKQMGSVDLKELYRRVAEWHLERGEYAPAYVHFYRAGEVERILSLLDRVGTVTNADAQFEGSFEMFGTTPREMLFEHPMAYLQYISLLLMSGDSAMAEDGSRRLDELQEHYQGTERVHPSLRNRILAEISIVQVFAVFNDVEKMVACTNEASRLLDGGQSSLLQRQAEFTFGSPHLLYSYYKERGHLEQTTDALAAGLPAFARVTDGCGTGSEYAVAAEYALETGDWQAAELNSLKAIYKAKTKDQTGITLCASFALIRLFILQGKTAEGQEVLRQLREDVPQANSAVYNTTLDLIEGYVYGCLGQSEKIPLWLKEGDMSPARFLFQGMAFNYIVYGKAVLLSKNYIELEMLTEAFAQYFSVFGNQLGFLHNQILESAAKYRLYGPEKGCAALRRALDMGREDRIILPFAEYAPAIHDMMRLIAQADTRDEYARTVLSCCERYMESLKNVSQEAASLSVREIQVLSLAAEGLKRGEIATRLTVSVGTVQTHLHNIYQKLEVGGRTAAIKKAQELKLI